MGRVRCLGYCVLLVLPIHVAPWAVADDSVSPTAQEEASLDHWFELFQDLCGQAFLGVVTKDEPGGDGTWSNERLVMHVRECEANRLAIPMHVGDDRSRTWRLERTDAGIQLKHDHRHEDGSEDAVTLYGGLGTATKGGQLDFPADEETKTLFEEHGLEPSVDNVWTLDIAPGQRLSYILRRPGRHFQVDFDLTETVDAPPPPWGSE